MGGSEFRESVEYDDDARKPQQQDAADFQQENSTYNTPRAAEVHVNAPIGAHQEMPKASAVGRNISLRTRPPGREGQEDGRPGPGGSVPTRDEGRPVDPATARPGADGAARGTGGTVRGEAVDRAESARRPEADAGLAEVLENARQLHELLREPELPQLLSGSDYERLRLEYRGKALRTASKTLDAANHAVETWLRLRHQNDALRSGQLREAIEALRDRSWWNQLLADHDLGGNKQAHDAATAIAQRIASMDATDVHADDLERLRRDIQELHQQITFAERHAEHLPTDTFRHYLTAAESIAWEVIVGATATSATTAISGGDARTAVITAAVGAGVGAILGQLRSAVSHWHAQHTIASQLHTAHRELRETIENLAFCLPALASDNPQVQASIQTVALAAEGLANHARQLASTLGPPLANGPYRNLLSTIGQLAGMARDPSSQGNPDLSTIAEKLTTANTALSGYTDLIKQLQSSPSRSRPARPVPTTPGRLVPRTPSRDSDDDQPQPGDGPPKSRYPKQTGPRTGRVEKTPRHEPAQRPPQEPPGRRDASGDPRGSGPAR